MKVKMSAIPGGKTGKVGKLSVDLGANVCQGDILVQVETQKGNRPVKAPESGMITKILCQEGDDVVSNQVLFELGDQGEGELSDGNTEQLVNNNQNHNIDTELLIIGAGPGGYVAAIYAAKKGLKVTLIEKDELGGTCLNVGCIPTKALVKSSETYKNIMGANDFGIDIDGTINVDMKKVIQRKDDVKDKLISGIDFLMSENKIDIIKGKASFVSDKEVAVEGCKNYHITFKDVIIGTGSKISKVDIPGIDLPCVMDSTDALSYTGLPKSITIIGGGVIGMEFAFIYRNLGVAVNVVEFMDRLLTMVDRDISEQIKKEAEEAGINVYTGAKVTNIQRAEGGQAVITYIGKEGQSLLISHKVLVAIGREPNLDGLDTQSAGIELTKDGKGIAVNDKMATNKGHIYAIGDVTNIIQLAHVASHQGIVAVENILGHSKDMDYSAVPNVIFTSPEIATVGIGEEEAQSLNMDYSTSRVSFMSNGKALTMNETAGFVKLIKDNSSNKIIGAAVIGPDASTLISALTLGIKNGLTEKEYTETIFAHPTTAEVIHEAAFGLSIGALHEA